MRNDQLHYLMEIISCGSISDAANKLHITQQALSLYVKSLEKECGVQLFSRSKKGVTLTKDGEALLPHFQTILKEYQTIMTYKDLLAKNTFGAYENIHGEIHFMCSSIIARTIVPKIDLAFRKQFPNVNLIIKEFENNNFQNIQHEGRYDIILSSSVKDDFVNQPSLKTYISEPLILDNLIVICSKDSALAKHKSISVSSLKKYSMAIYHTVPVEEVWTYKHTFLKNNVKPQSIYQCDIESAIFEALQHRDMFSLYGKIAFKYFPLKDYYNLTSIKINNSVEFYYILNTLKSSSDKIYIQYLNSLIKEQLLSLS